MPKPRTPLGALPLPMRDPAGAPQLPPPVTIDLGDGVPITLHPIVPARTGRPSRYTPELAARIIHELRAGMTPPQIAQRFDWSPEHETIYAWIAGNPEFSAAVARARRIGASAMADETLRLADNAVPDEKGRVEKDRLRITARQWLAGKYDSRFADRQVIQHEEHGQAVELEQVSTEGLQAGLRAIQAALARKQAVDVSATPASPDVASGPAKQDQ